MKLDTDTLQAVIERLEDNSANYEKLGLYVLAGGIQASLGILDNMLREAGDEQTA